MKNDPSGFTAQPTLTKSNGITEGFHRKMKLIQRRAYGFRNFGSSETILCILYLIQRQIMEFEDPYEKLELIEVLQYLVQNDYLSHHEAAIGISKKIIGEKSFDNLSPAQEKVYDDEIRPLLYPSCIGVVTNDDDSDNDTCVSGGIVDVASLLESYMIGEMLCQHCRHIRIKHNEE